MENVETLEVMPSGCEQFERQYYGSQRREIVNSMVAERASHQANVFLPLQSDPVRRVLIEEYGCPNSFRQGEWKRDVEEVWDGIIRQALD